MFARRHFLKLIAALPAIGPRLLDKISQRAEAKKDLTFVAWMSRSPGERATAISFDRVLTAEERELLYTNGRGLDISTYSHVMGIDLFAVSDKVPADNEWHFVTYVKPENGLVRISIDTQPAEAENI